MSSVAEIKSWNFSGWRGVNSATAGRTLAGSNEFICGSVLDADGKFRWWSSSNAQFMKCLWLGRG